MKKKDIKILQDLFIDAAQPVGFQDQGAKPNIPQMSSLGGDSPAGKQGLAEPWVGLG